jgi:hypothetical protein
MVDIGCTHLVWRIKRWIALFVITLAFAMVYFSFKPSQPTMNKTEKASAAAQSECCRSRLFFLAIIQRTLNSFHTQRTCSLMYSSPCDTQPQQLTSFRGEALVAACGHRQGTPIRAWLGCGVSHWGRAAAGNLYPMFPLVCASGGRHNCALSSSP